MTPPNRQRILEHAAGQHGLVTSDQLTRAGYTKDARLHAVRSGRLFRVHPGVYAVGRPDRTREARWLAAVLACGDEALLSHRAAARLWGLIEDGGERPEILLPSGSGRRSTPAYDVHRTTTLSPGDRARRARVPVTSVQRTLIDLALVLDAKALKAAVRQAERLYRIDLAGLHGRVARPRTSVPHGRLFALLSELVPAPLTDSELEVRFFELCAKHRLPRPENQYEIGPLFADFCWPDVRLVVETDGWGTHGTMSAFLDDRVKERAFKAAGFDVERFSWTEVVYHPGAVAREVRLARARRRRDLGVGG